MFRLFVGTAVDGKDDIEEKLERNYQTVQRLISGLSDIDAHEALTKAILKEKGYEDISLGLLATILFEPQNSARSYRDLTLISHDGFAFILGTLSQFIQDRYQRFTDVVKGQVIWLLRELIKNNVNGADSLFWCIMRFAAGGDISPKNLALIESLLDVLCDYRGWLDKFPFLISSVIYTFLRLVEDHNSPTLVNLRKKEVTFLVTLMRERFIDCINIGRDLIRLMQNVARIPEFEQLWKDMLFAPKTLSPNFTGILQILQCRTSRRFLQSRLTPEMERKLVFFTSQVRFGNHKRYQDWFQRQYLATPESQSLRCDIIRFIVGVIHPSNELLCSDIIPRWAVIGWLLTTCTSIVTVPNAKLALFYDWFFYDTEKDNIMNIEPAILVMHHSMRSHPAISATLLDFLCRIIPNYYYPLTNHVRLGIFTSLRQILDKRVLASLLPLFDNAKLDRELRLMVRETFKEFCTNEEFNSSPAAIQNHITNNHMTSVSIDLDEPSFSDDDTPTFDYDTDDDDIPLSKVRLKELKYETDPFAEVLQKLHTERDRESRCELMQTFLQLYETNALEMEAADTATIAKTLSSCIQLDLKCDTFPSTPTKEALLDHIKSPLFVLYRTLYISKDKTQLLKLISLMHQHFPKMSYLLLYFLKVQIRASENKRDDQTKASALKVSLYKDYCQSINKKVETCLLEDITECHIYDTKLMIWLIPDLFRDFKQYLLNNAQFIRIILSAIDARQLQALVGKVLQGHLVMLRPENVQPLIKDSLQWESFEQMFLWQLVHAHDIHVDVILPLVPLMDYELHSEALTSILLLLKQERPNAEYIKCLFSRPTVAADMFNFSIIKYWCDEYIDKVAEIMAALLCSRYPSTSPNKRKRQGKTSISLQHLNAGGAASGAGANANLSPTAEKILDHLELLRVVCDRHDCMAIFTLDAMQRALNVAQTNCTDIQKKHYQLLFALLEDDDEDDDVMTKSRMPARGRKVFQKQSAPVTNSSSNTSSTTNQKKVTNTKNPPMNSESSVESTEEDEEEIVKPKQAKKRKKVVSDSD